MHVAATLWGMSDTTTRTPVAPFTVVRVVDTREWVEGPDERWVAIPGSGDVRQCDRCDRTHEIHAHVTDAAGQAWIVGTGCMDEDTAIARRVATKASTVARNAAKAADKVARTARLAELTGLLPVFPHHRVVFTELTSGPWKGQWAIEGADGYSVRGFVTDPTDAERLACLESHWLEARLADLAGGVRALYDLRRG